MEMRESSDLMPRQGADEQALDPAISADAQPQTDTDTSTLNEPETSVAPDPEAAVEEEVTEAIEEEDVENPRVAPTKESLIAAAKEMLEVDASEIQRDALTHIRQQFNNLRKAEIEAARDQWAADGNAPEDFVLAEDADEVCFNELVAQIREKKNAWNAAQEAERQENLVKKNEIIEKITALADDTDNVNRTFPLYRQLQDAFNAIGPVPPTEETSVWKRFQEAREKYSDNLKINKELRDYDFKKNLDSKNLLVSEAEKLADEEDVILAFRRLQELHDKWRQIGPVAKELRDDIWAKFKDASAVVNKKYQAFFEERKAREQKNELAKTELCERIEAIDLTSVDSFAEWDRLTNEVIALQNEWKTFGFASRKVNNALFARFRARCDEFFAKKAAYFKEVKEQYAANLARKIALVERAEALKDSTDWRKTTDELVVMQKEWKSIGAVPKRHSDAIWKRFLAACDAFFDNKKSATSSQRSEEQANLKAKNEIIAGIQGIGEDLPDNEAAEMLRELQERWQAIGHVPYRDKDKVNDAYREAVGAVRRRINKNESRARMDRFESNLAQMGSDQQKLYRERDRLVRAIETRRNELRTYENNLGFLTSKSKSGESMVNEFRRKIDRLKEDIASIKEKIDILDSKLKG